MMSSQRYACPRAAVRNALEAPGAPMTEGKMFDAFYVAVIAAMGNNDRPFDVFANGYPFNAAVGAATRFRDDAVEAAIREFAAQWEGAAAS
jgi:hypothetical protein